MLLVLTVGLTPEPLIESIQKNKPEYVILIHPRLTIQAAKECLEKVLSEANSVADHVKTVEVEDYYDLLSCMKGAEEAVKMAMEYDGQIIVDFTGGTKVMGATMFYVFQRSITDVVFEYVAGERDQKGEVLASELRKYEGVVYRERLRTALEHARSYRFDAALAILESVEDDPRVNMAKKAIQAFLEYDAFRYRKALSLARRYSGNDPLLKPYSYEISRLLKVLPWLVNVSDFMKEAQEGNLSKKGMNAISRYGPFLAVDALKNAERRLKRGYPTAAVLRAYRAVEVSMHVVLLSKGINPWKERPFGIGFDKAASLLAKHRLLPDIRKDLRLLTTARNTSYLEHGYVEISLEYAKRILSYARDYLGVIMKLSSEKIKKMEGMLSFFESDSCDTR